MLFGKDLFPIIWVTMVFIMMMSFHSENVDFVMDFCMNILSGFIGALRPLKQRAE